ncbi:MAG: MGMT family protein [Sporosarcina sp.]
MWNALIRIHHAETESYKDIAVSIGNEKAVRVVGTVNGEIS